MKHRKVRNLHEITQPAAEVDRKPSRLTAEPACETVLFVFLLYSAIPSTPISEMFTMCLTLCWATMVN